jgi:hypothetical protein
MVAAGVAVGSFRRHRLIVSTVASLALLGNLIAAVVCCLPSKSDLAGYPTALLGPLVLCSHAADSPSPADGPSPDQPTKCCPLCAPSFAAVLIIALTLLTGLLLISPSRLVPGGVFPTLADRLRRAGLGSRAPPLPA